MPPLDARSFLLFGSLVFLVMPITVWAILHRVHRRPQLVMWCLAGAGFGASMGLVAMRGMIADPLSIHLANCLLFLSFGAAWSVLRWEAELEPRWALSTTAAVVFCALFLWATRLDEIVRAGIGHLLVALCTSCVAFASWQLVRITKRRSARLILWANLLLAGIAMLRGARNLAGVTDGIALSTQIDYLLLAGSAAVAAILTNLGYLGMALDRMRANDRAQSAAIERYRELQQLQEAASRTRSALAEERARTTRLLAHEVRQPLHNAAVALQAAVATLAHSHEPTDAAHAIEQAQNVIQRVAATLDNTVAATTLLAGEGQLTTGDTDLEILGQLCIDDLPPESRPRVRLEHRADARSAQMEASLVRLAVRNLLINATLYSPPDSTVELRMLDSDDPLALVIEVADQGPGVPEELRGAIFEPGVRGGQHGVPGHGLGLHVVQRVAALHGGSIEWRANTPRGSVFRLIIPQGNPG